MKLPETPEEFKLAAAGFHSISYKEAIPNCVGVLDGYQYAKKEMGKECEVVLLLSLSVPWTILTPGKAQTDFAQQLWVDAIFMSKGCWQVFYMINYTINIDHHNHRMCVKEHLLDLGIDHFIDLLVWDLFHE